MASFDSSHWYRADGTPCYELPAKSRAGMRSVTIKDARELNLFPSVTTVLSILAKPQLDRWKQEQVAKACFFDMGTKMRYLELGQDDYVAAMIDAAFQQVDDAADLGTSIHKALEQHFQGLPYDQALKVYVEAVDALVKREGIEFDAHEVRLVNKVLGYAGLTDAKYRRQGRIGIGDFKTRKTYPGKPCTPYDGQPMQIAAYFFAAHHTLDAMEGEGCNIWISTTEPGRVEVTYYGGKQLIEEMAAFEAALALWKHIKGYDPRHVS